MMAVIYALTEPTGEVRYVGYAENPERRLAWHWKEGRRRTHKSCWLASLRDRDLKPGLRILEVLDANEDWRAREIWWIAEMRRQGCDLTNGTDGGEGGYIPAAQTPEAKAKRAAALRGQKRSTESRARMSALATGRQHTLETRRKVAAARLGASISPEVRAKISASLVGVSKTPEHAENIGKAKRGENSPHARLTEVQVREIRKRVTEGESRKDLALLYGVSYSTVVDIVLGRRWRHVLGG